MSEREPGNVFLFSFDMNGFEAIINLTEIDQNYVMAKISGEPETQSVGSVVGMIKMRSQFNQERRMEVWMLKLDESFTETELWDMARRDPQLVADLARKGEHICGNERRNQPQTIV